MARMVVIADDVTGAADCAAASASRGCKAVVILHSYEGEQLKSGWPDADILSIDGNSRCLTPEQASQSTSLLVQLCDSHNTDCPEYVLFKKIDSTLRGNVANELAALLHVRRSTYPKNAKLSILFAPALPSQGRTTVDGHLFVHGVRLEETDIYQTETRTAQSDISKILAKEKLSSRLIGLDVSRSGATSLRLAIRKSAEQSDVVVCDAETDEDLVAIAEASVGEAALTALAGSAGLASQIARAIGIGPVNECRDWGFSAGATLFVIGTAASVTRQQAHMLETSPDLTTFRFPPAVLQTSPDAQTQIMQNLRSSRDVLLLLDEGEHCSTHELKSLSKALSDLMPKCAQFLGGLVATGGETARAALDGLGIDQLRLIGEVEAGLPFSVAYSWLRPLPVITKAGAFGSPQALIRCREFLRELKRLPARLPERALLEFES